MIRIPLTIGMLAALCVLCLGCDRRLRKTEVTVEQLVASFADAKLRNATDVQYVIANASASPRAILFVNLDWAIMDPMRERFAEFSIEYRQIHPNEPLLFHFVDCTQVTNGYGPLRSLPGWQELHDAAGTSLIHGCGELVWIENGRVLHVEPILNYESTSDLIDKTESLMPT